MLFDPNRAEQLGRLQERLRRTQALTPELMSDVIAQACVRFAAHNAHTRTRVDQLIKSGAWLDATLALIELELPQWKVRRIACEDGEWRCSLSNDPRLPTGLDDTADATHEILPLAILSAFLEARRVQSMSNAPGCRTVPRVRPEQFSAICCDNFA